MAENVSSKTRFLFLLTLPVLFLFGWYCLDIIEERREQSIRLQHLDTLRNLLPLIKERLSAKSLAHEKMLAGLHRISILNPKAARLIVSRWLRAFGPDIKCAIWDKDRSLLASHGFVSEDLDAVLTVMIERETRETLEQIPSSVYFKFRSALTHLFGDRDITFLGRNPIALRTSTFLGKTGQLMIGPWFPEMVFDIESFKDLANASETAFASPAPCAGIITLFVPHRVIRTSRWLKKTLDLPTASFGIPRIHLVSTRRLLTAGGEIPGLAPELARTVAFEAETVSEGALLDEEMTGVAYAQKAGWPNAIALHVTDMQRPFRLARSPAMAGLLALFIAAILLIARFETTGNVAAGLLRQCILICAIVSCIPVTGLIWTGLIGSQSRSDSRRADVMQRLEQRLEQIEASHASYMSTLIKPVRKFLEDPEWRKGPLPTDQVASSLVELKNSQLQTLFVIEADGTPHHFTQAILGDKREDLKQMQTLITSLLQFIQSTIISRISESDGPQRQNFQRELKGGMVYDTIALAVGPETVYQLALTFDQLMPFQLFHESASVIFHNVLDESLKSSLLLFAVMKEKLIIQLELVEIINRQIQANSAVPPLILMQYSQGEWPTTNPIAQAMEPGMNLLLRRVKSEGGNIKTQISIKGTPCYVLARPLTGMSMVGAAIEPVGHEDGASIPPALFAAAYPVTIVALALMLFQSFFLRPVGEMRKTVEAIAAGDYERRLPVLTDDEIGSLCLSFNNMAKDLAEKEFLRRFISDLTMQAVAGRHRQTATRLTATVMFTDIRGFTTMSETQPPEKITAMLNEYLTRMESVIEAHGGSIDKFIGDAIMAVFLPTHGMAPSGERAIRAAFGMRRELEAFNKARRTAGESTIAIGSGIATGQILMGILGRSDGRQDFTVTGPTVNKSAAMEKRSKETRRTPIVACPATIEAVTVPVETEPLPDASDRPAGFEVASIDDSGVSLIHSRK